MALSRWSCPTQGLLEKRPRFDHGSPFDPAEPSTLPRTGTPECRIRQQCILVGELVVWNDRVQDIMPFYKIRRYVCRVGQRLGCRGDSLPAPEEHLMIVLHDLLVWDEHVTPTYSHTQRGRKLQDLVTPIRGLVAIGYRT